MIFNCALFAVLISFPQSLPPIGKALPRWSRLLARVAVWSTAWFAVAYAITYFRHALPGATTLLTGSSLFALAFMLLCWTPQAATLNDTRGHWTGFMSFWGTEGGLWRIVFFCLAYTALILVTRAAFDEKWIGMASALPLLERAAFGQGELALGINRKKDDRRLGDDPAEVLLGVA